MTDNVSQNSEVEHLKHQVAALAAENKAYKSMAGELTEMLISCVNMPYAQLQSKRSSVINAATRINLHIHGANQHGHI